MRFFGRSIADALSYTIPGSLQRRLVNYTLKYLLGSYVLKDLSQENLDLQVLDGVLTLTDLELRIDSLNDKLAGAGLVVERGHIDKVQISVPWANVVSGKVTVLLEGVHLAIAPQIPVEDLAQTVHELDRDITSGLRSMTESFLEHEHQKHTECSEDLPEPALLQQVLDTVIRGLTIEIVNLAITLSSALVPQAIQCEVASLSCEPSPDGVQRSVTMRDLDIYLLQDTAPKPAHKPTGSTRSTSSRSSSSSSYQDAELIQSTIFGVEQSRSLFMSAMSFQGDNEQSIVDTAREETNVKRHILSCNGLHGLVTATEQSLAIDLSWDAIRVGFGRSELLALISCVGEFLPLATNENTTTQPSKSSEITWSSRFSSVHSEADICHNMDLDSRDLMDATKLILKFQRLSISSLARGEVEIDVPFLEIDIGSTRLRSSSTMSFGTLRICSTQGYTGTLCPLVLDLDLANAIVYLSELRALASVILECSEHQTSETRREESEDDTSGQAAQLSCPSIDFVLSDYGQAVLVTCTDSVVQWTTNLKRARLSLSFGSLIAKIQNQVIFSISSLEMPNILDFTICRQKPAPTVLEFINYAEVFDHPERDHKTEVNTLKALRQKSKDAADQVIRVSFGRLSTTLTREKTLLCTDLCWKLRHALTSLQPSSLPNSASAAQETGVTLLLGEARECVISVELGTEKLCCNVTKVSCFLVHNFKKIVAGSLDIRDLLLTCSNTDSGETSRLLHSGLHLHELSTRSTSILSARFRHNLSGKNIGGTMIRLGLADAQIEYFPDMPWLSALRVFMNDLGTDEGALPRSHKTSATRFRFAVDLINVSLGLNPYAGKSKALLYMQRAIVQGSTILSTLPTSLKIHPGVMDLFLIDDIDGGQNDKRDSPRIRNDPITSKLLKLGFVKIASLETVEISLHEVVNEWEKRNYIMDVVGAILTITTCADSLATFMALVNLLRVPIAISDELKYKLGLTETGEVLLDTFADIDEDAFRPPDRTNYRETVNSLNAAEKRQQTLLNGGATTSPKVLDDYFLSQSVVEQGRLPEAIKPRERLKHFVLNSQKCFVVWNLHDGYDWEHTRKSISLAVENAIEKAQKRAKALLRKDQVSDFDEQVDEDFADADEVGDVLFNSIYISLPVGAQSEDVTKAINQELAQADASDTATQTTTTALPKPRRRQPEDAGSLQLGRSKTHKVRMEFSGIDTQIALFEAAEGDILSEVSLQIRDIEVMDNVSTSTWRKFMTYYRGAGPRDTDSLMAHLDITSIRPIAGLAAAELAIKAHVAPLRLHVDQDTLEFLTRFFEFKDSNVSLEPDLPAEEIYVQRFEIQAIPIQVDYKPKRLDFKSLRSGRTTEFKNLFILEDSNMILKHVVLYGVCGLARIFQHLNDIWLGHIKATQLSSVLAGVSPIRSLASFGSGLKKLVTVPLSEYRKDGRLVPGIRKGVDGFLRDTGSEAVRLGAKLAIGTQGLLQTAENSLSDNTELRQRAASKHAVSMYADQPKDLRQGISQAIGGMSRHVILAKDAIISIPGDIEEETDARGVVRVAAKSVPIAVLRPLIGTTEMISKTLLGLRNTMDPEQRRMNNDKYKSAN